MPSKHSRRPVGPPRLPRARRKKTNSPTAGLHRLAHQIVNQLTVINLSCFKLCITLKEVALNASGDIERLQNAVAEMNSLVEILSQLEQQSTVPGVPACPKTPVNANALPDNVYPLFETKKTTG